ncbi:papain-like cysteine protease family protein [Labrys okinawensis]|uniref:papain-like cysteine protease family protein n=1 Tax=Labrys okinawensis TaxID=346911 RepID=UPI0039BD05CC
MPDTPLFDYTLHYSGQLATSKTINNILFVSAHLPFNMQTQTQTNWCWAATSTSVSHFYWRWSGWTQCLVANGELGFNNCCSSPVPSPCNVPWYLDRALTLTQNLDHMVSATITFQAIKAEIDAGRVIGARIGWSGGGGHFVAIYGYSRVGPFEFLDIDDPIYGKSHPSLATFTSNYRGSGQWTHTYFTKRWPNLHVILADLPPLVARRIQEIRPLVGMKNAVPEQTESADASLAAAHLVYVAGITDIQKAKGDDIFSSSSQRFLRVFDVENGKATALYDLDQGEAAGLRSFESDPATVELMQQGADEASRLATKGKAPPELRFVSIPALYVEAFWLHYEDAGEDIFVPVRGIGLFKPLEAMPARKFNEIVMAAARDRKPADPTDSIAP